MEGVGPGLENHGHRRSRRESVVGAIVRCQRAKLCNGVRGWRDAHAARATAVIIFATVQQIDVVVLAHAIEFDVGVSADWCVDVTVDLARRPRRQSGKLVNASPTHRELRQLLVGDDVADLTGIGLDTHGVGFYRYCFTGPAYRHLIVQPCTLTNL